MSKKFAFLFGCILVIGGLLIVGCSEQHASVDKSTDKPSVVERDLNGENVSGKNEYYEINESEIAEHLEYDNKKRSLYIAGLKVFEEFSTSNEGSASISTDENTITFSMTKSTGTVTGALDGPSVSFRMDLDTKKITDKNFTPAPNYKELGMEEFSEHSEELIELTEERMLEIGKYFKELILEIETKIEANWYKRKFKWFILFDLVI